MYEIQREVRELEVLRQRAQMGYGIFAFGLLAAVLMAFLSNVIWAAAIGILAVGLYVLICRRDVKAYRKRYRNARIFNEMQGFLTDGEIADRDLFLLEQIRQDRAVVGEITHGVLRVGIRGKVDRGIKGELADAAFPAALDFGGNKRKNVILSGCYMRFTLNRDSGLYMACFKKGNLMEMRLDEYYRSLGLEPRRWKDFLFFVPEETLPGEKFRDALQKLDDCSNGEEILMVDHDHVFLFLRGRFLETGEPDYKHPVTMEALQKRYLPELPYVKKLLFQCMEVMG